MPLVLTTSHITSKKKDSNCIESFTYGPEDQLQRDAKGTLSILLASPTSGEDPVFFARGIFSHIKTEYYQKVGGDSLRTLKEAVSGVVGLMENSELLACVFIDAKMFCVVTNGARIVLVREGVYATLLRSRDGETASLSGHIKSGDLFILGTRKFFEVITEDMLRASVSSRSPESIAEFLEPIITVQEEEAAGAIVVKAHERNEKWQNTLSENPLYIHRPLEDITKRKKTPIIAGLILVMLLVGSIVIGMKKREVRLREEEFQKKIDSIQSKVDESTTLAHINPTRAREVFGQAQEEVLGISTDNGDEGRVNELKQKIKDVQEEVLGEKPVDLALFVDLGLLSDGFSAKQITSDGDLVYILDSEHERIAKISLSSKRAEVVAGPQVVDTTKEITAYTDLLYGLMNDGIYKLMPNKKVIGDAYSNALISAYAGNIYVLNKTDSKIYRYAGGAEPKSIWLTEGVEASLGDSIQMLIDGTIWVLKENGELQRFSNGNPVVFSLYGAVPGVVHPVSFYTDENSEYLYVLDPENARIVVATKGGEFLTQYVGDQLRDAKFVVVSEKAKRMFTIMENKVYSMELGDI